MDTPLKPLLSSDVDADLEDDDDRAPSSYPPPRYDVSYASHPEVDHDDELENAEFVKWWEEVRSQPQARESVLRIVRDWSSDDRRRNAMLVHKSMITRAAALGIVSMVLLGAGSFLLWGAGSDVRDSHNVGFDTAVSLTSILPFLGSAFLAYQTAVLVHIVHRIRRSLRIADADDARIYIPPVAILIRGTRFTRRPPFYEPVPFVACEDLRELGMRIHELEDRLHAQERNGDPLARMEWSA